MSSSNYDSSSPRAGLVARATTSSPHLRAGAAGDLERPPSPSPDLTAVPTLRTPRPRQSGYRGLCRPSLARVHAPTPSPSAFSPSPPHVSSGGGGNYSEWRVQLLAFLNEYAINSEKTAVYKVLAALTRETASLSFQIHFEHLLEYDKELAYAICNSQDSRMLLGNWTDSRTGRGDSEEEESRTGRNRAQECGIVRFISFMVHALHGFPAQAFKRHGHRR